MEKITDKINLIFGIITAGLAGIFGKHWYLFLAFAILNIADYITGLVKAKMKKKESSNKGLSGIIKKVGYWAVVAISFFIGFYFAEMGEMIGIDLGFAEFVGWFTLAAFIINEIRSVLENLVEMGVEVPEFLTKGLEAAEKKIKNNDSLPRG